MFWNVTKSDRIDTAVTDDNDNWTYRNERRPNRSLFDDV